MSDVPTLWQVDVSHYSEKARWALAWKGVEHRRRSPPPGAHMIVALWLTRGAGYTFPVLSIDGRQIADSTAIIAALEERYPGKDRERFGALMKSTAPGAPAKLPPGLTAAYARLFTALRFRAGDAEKAERAWTKVLAPTSPPPRSSTLWPNPRRDRCRPTRTPPRASRPSASRCSSAAASSGSTPPPRAGEGRCRRVNDLPVRLLLL